MVEFASEYRALEAVKEIVGDKLLVDYSNEGIEVVFTTLDNNEGEIFKKLKAVFSEVELKGRIIKKIKIKRLNIEKQGFRVTKVTY